MKSKKLITSMLTLSMLASTIVPAYAAETNEVVDPLPGTGYSKITVEVKDNSGGGGTDPDNPDNPDIPPVDPTDIIIATVPVELPIIMDLKGNVTVPTDAKIINHVEDKGIKVTDISVTLDPSWSAANFSDDFTAKADNTKELGLSFRGDTLNADGTFTITEGNWNIAKNSNLPLNMAAKLPKQTTASKTQAATVGFTIDWSGLDGTDGGSDPDAGKDNSGGSGEVNPPEEVTYTVSFTTDGNGILEGDTTATIKGGEPAPFPTAKPSSIRYEHTGWVDATTNSPIEPTTPITSDTTIKAVFSERAASPKNWFTTDGANTITGLSAEYLDLVDAPTDLVIPKTIGGSTIKAIGANAFANKDLITSIVIPNSITSISADAFSGCDSLTEINLDYSQPYRIQNSPFGLTKDKIKWGAPEEWDTNPMISSEVIALNLAFNSPTGTIKASNTNISGEINLPSSIDGVKVTTIDKNAFNNCGYLTNVTIPNCITSIKESAFSSCTSLTSINIPDSVTTIEGSAFYFCKGLNSITIPDSVLSIGDDAFACCFNLNKIEVDAKNQNYSSDSGILFNKDKTILMIYPAAKVETSYDIPNSVKTIGDYAFYNCTNLSSLTIPDGVTTIGSVGVRNCTGLSDIIIPNSVTTIGSLAFAGCTGVESINIPNNVRKIDDFAFENVKHITYNGTAKGAPWRAKSMN